MSIDKVFSRFWNWHNDILYHIGYWMIFVDNLFFNLDWPIFIYLQSIHFLLFRHSISLKDNHALTFKQFKANFHCLKCLKYFKSYDETPLTESLMVLLRQELCFFSSSSWLLVQALNVRFDMLNTTWKPPLTGNRPVSWILKWSCLTRTTLQYCMCEWTQG